MLATLLRFLGLRDSNGCKPCAHCREKNPALSLTDGLAQVNCRNCYAAGPAIIAELNKKATPRDEAIRRWNKRKIFL